MPRRLFSFSLLGLLISASLCSAQTFRSLSLQTNDLVYSRATGKIYASIPSSSPLFPNTITTIDPVTGAIGTSVAIGNNPGQLAISDDGRSIYAAINGGAAVRKFDTLTQMAGLQYTLGNNFGPNLVQDMGVLPGLPNSVAINLRNNGISPDFVGLGIFDEGVRRPNITAGYTTIAIASSTTIYAYNGETTAFDFDGISVNASGAQRSFEAHGLISGFGIGIKYDKGTGLVYASNGAVIDPVARRLVGTYVGTGINPFLPDSSRNNTYFITPPSGSGLFRFLIYNESTFSLLSSVAIPGLTSDAGSLIRLDNNGLAFRSNTNVYLAALPVPEPSSIGLLLGGCVGSWLWFRWRLSSIQVP